MVRNLVAFCGLLAAIGVACHPAQAGDRKSTSRVQETKAILIAPDTRTAGISYARREASPAGVLQTGYALSTRRGSDREKENTSARERQPLTLFHINSKFGDIAVQPVIGKVNGAQFSLGF